MFRYCTFIITLLLCSVTACPQQTIKEYLQQNIKEVKTINTAPDDQYADLQELGAAIGTARIVMLGEQDHGDAPAFLAKTRIIRYLHEQLGFEVLAFESDFWALESISKLSADSFSISEVRNNTYDVWSRCVQAQPMYEYIDATTHTNNPLIITGIDCRHSRPYSQAHYLHYLTTEVLPAITLTAEDRIFFLNTTTALLSKEFTMKPANSEAAHFYNLCTTIQQQLPANTFAAVDIQSLNAGAHNAWNLDYTNPARDIQMEANLQWLAEYVYPHKKIIVWAHSMHIAKNLKLITDKETAPYNTTLGNETFNHFGQQLYILGFDSYYGTAGRVGSETYKVKPGKKSSIEQYAFATNYAYAFINLQNRFSGYPFYMKGLSHVQSLKTDWSRIFDGILYIRDMYPCDERQ